jgi:undecaprenyl-diphosphatase
MDYDVSHALDRFSAHHDGFEDLLGGYVSASEVIFAVIVVMLFLAVPGRWRRTGQRAAVAAGASFVVAALLAHFIGSAIDRPRPFVAHGSIHAFLSHAADPSFPSDHATAAFAIAVAVAIRQRLWGSVLLVLAVALSVGRVFLGLHYPSDVVAGALLGTAVAAITTVTPVRAALDSTADALARALDAVLGRVVRAKPS